VSSWQKQKLNLTFWSPWIRTSCINKNWQDAGSPLWFSNHPPIALNTSGSTFLPLLWPSRRSRLGRSFRSAGSTDRFDANSAVQNAYGPRVRLPNQPVLLETVVPWMLPGDETTRPLRSIEAERSFNLGSDGDRNKRGTIESREVIGDG